MSLFNRVAASPTPVPPQTTQVVIQRGGRKRVLTEVERALVDKGMKQWIPNPLVSYGTPLWKLLADAQKQASVWAHSIGIPAGVLGGVVDGPAGVAIGIGVGLLAGAYGYLKREQENENLLDIMQRSPENATYRDYLLDPVVQAERNRDYLLEQAADKRQAKS